MATTLWYTDFRLDKTVSASPKPRRRNKRMSTQVNASPEQSTSQGPATKKVTRTVFDLTAFDDIQLTKDVILPAKPATIEEALAAVGNDQSKLLNVIYEGLVADATDTAWKNIEGFKIVNEDGEPGEVYTGKFADGEKSKLINNAILSLAKMQGYDKSLPKEKKAALKESATTFLRSNPAMLASLQG